MFLVASGVIGLGYGSVFPSFQAIAIKSAPNERRGLATGTYFLLLDTGMGVGSFVLGMIASAMNYSFMYVVSALMVVFGGITYYTLHHRRAVIRKKREGFAGFEPARVIAPRKPKKLRSQRGMKLFIF